MRCIRAVKALRAHERSELRVIALYTDADRDAPFVRHADAVERLDAPRGEVAAYLDHDGLLDALRRAGADAVWPGWGFVAEDPRFVERVTAAGIRFLGPSAEAMRQLGDKISAKQLARRLGRAGLALERGRGRERGPGGASTPRGSATRWWSRPAAGGGGRGIRIVARPEDLAAAFRVRRLRGARRLRRRAPLPRAQGLGRPPHRGPDRRRPGRRGARARLPRLLGAAPTPEGDRGGAAAGAPGPPARRALGRRRADRPEGRLHGRRHRRVPRLGRRALLPRDEPAPPGRARRHRVADRASTWSSSRSGSRAARRSRCSRCARRASRSRRASAPRIRTRASCRRPAGSPASIRRSGRACASTPASPPAARSRRPSIR